MIKRIDETYLRPRYGSLRHQRARSDRSAPRRESALRTVTDKQANKTNKHVSVQDIIRK
jgi:hypothetical protein